MQSEISGSNWNPNRNSSQFINKLQYIKCIMPTAYLYPVLETVVFRSYLRFLTVYTRKTCVPSTLGVHNSTWTQFYSIQIIIMVHVFVKKLATLENNPFCIYGVTKWYQDMYITNHSWSDFLTEVNVKMGFSPIQTQALGLKWVAMVQAGSLAFALDSTPRMPAGNEQLRI
jgi:hypothetical protein